MSRKQIEKIATVMDKWLALVVGNLLHVVGGIILYEMFFISTNHAIINYIVRYTKQF